MTISLSRDKPQRWKRNWKKPKRNFVSKPSRPCTAFRGLVRRGICARIGGIATLRQGD